MVVIEKCQACTFYMVQRNENGICQRTPPALLIYPNASTVSVFPPMLVEGWFGEFTCKESKQ